MNLGYLSNSNFISNFENQKSNMFYIKKKIMRVIYRFLVFINYFSPIYFYFVANKYIYNNCIKKRRILLSKILPFLNVQYFKNVYKINSKTFDTNNKKKNQKKKYIIFIDGNYKHLDILLREKINVKTVKKIYFKKLKKLLNHMSKLLRQKVVLCLHPSSNLKEYSDYFTDFSVSKFETHKEINNASIVIFHESSGIMDAILKKKRIISLKTRILGNYIFERIKLYQKNLNFVSIDLDQDKIEINKNIIKDLDTKLKFYNSYINNYLKSDDDRNGSQKIIKIIKSF